MKKLCEQGLYIGTDGCRGGWITAVLDHEELRLERYDSIEQLIKRYPVYDAFLIDMVIGLRSGPSQLRPDELARRELGPRSATIFPVPCRAAVYAEGEAAQKRENFARLGKSLSKQTINIIPKMRELDEFFTAFPAYKNKILESHPELDFARLNGHVLLSSKKDIQGLRERAAVLEKYLPLPALDALRERARMLRCNPDDLLDALCLAVTAALAAKGQCETIPEQPETDENGLLMRLTLPRKNVKQPIRTQG